jgi:hypothetical protein
MTLISPQRLPQRTALNIRVDTRFLAVLKAYADCIASTQEYIVQEAVLRMFVADRDFRQWLQDGQLAAAKALDGLVADRPARHGRQARPMDTATGRDVTR